MVSALPWINNMGQRPFLTSLVGLNRVAFLLSMNRFMPTPFFVVSAMALKAITPNGRGEYVSEASVSLFMASIRAICAPDAAPAAVILLGSSPSSVWLFFSHNIALSASSIASSAVALLTEDTRYWTMMATMPRLAKCIA